MTQEKIKELREAAEKANNKYPLNRIGLEDEDYNYECPTCDGEGAITGDAIVNYDTEYAASIHVYGIGASLNSLESFISLANPATVLELLDERERLREALDDILLLDQSHKSPRVLLNMAIKWARKIGEK